MHNQNIKTIRKIMGDIIPTLKKEAGEQSSQGDFSYTQQRAMINQIFAMTSGTNYNVPSIMLRLTVIDSLYSTNAQYSYFSIEDMANKISGLGDEKAAAEYFYSLVMGEGDEKHLFSSRYGIRKNCEDGSQQISLMSKYAYYVLIQNPAKYPLGFPIYDSLAIEMYPLVCSKVEVPARSKSYIGDSIEQYIEALNKVREKIFHEEDLGLFNDYQQYDVLDAYLWRMGKVNNGNYSLLFTRTEYEQFIQNLGIRHMKEEEDYGVTLYRKLNDTEWKDKRLIKVIQDNNGKTKYSYDFNTIVQHQCATLPTETILQGLSECECIEQLIEHWKKFYLEAR